jgi:hypothetical protein
MQMNEAEKIAIFIPAYNVAHTLPLVIDRIPREIKEIVKEIFVALWYLAWYLNISKTSSYNRLT